MGSYLFYTRAPLCLSHCKTHWTMLVNNVGLEICPLGTSNFMVTLTFSPLV